MNPIPAAALRPVRLLGLVTPLVIMAGLVVLLLLPNLVMHTGLRSHASVTLPGGDAASQSAVAAVESPPVMR